MRDGRRRLGGALVATLAVTLLTVSFEGICGASERVAIQAGRIITVAGPELTDGVVLIEDGRISAVGEGLEIPFDAMVIDASKGVVFPGLVEAHTQNGLDRPNESLPVTPFVSVYDAIDPVSYYFEDALREGVITIGIIPGNDCVIGGMGRVVRPRGMTVEEMTVLEEMGLKLSMAPKRGMNRMTQMAELRKAFWELEDSLESLAEKKYVEKNKSGKEDKEDKEEFHYDPAVARKEGRALIEDKDVESKYLNLLRLSRGELPAFIYCERAMDVPHAIEVARENHFFDKAVLVLGPDCFKAVDLIKEAGLPVILSPILIYEERDRITNKKTKTFVPGVFADKGVPFALQRSSRADLARGHLWYQAAVCVREGLAREKALKAISQWPAEIIGVGERLGTIEAGKEADLLILTGDPLAATTWVDKVLLAGEVVYERAGDERLQKLLHGRETADASAASEDAAGKDAAENKVDGGSQR